MRPASALIYNNFNTYEWLDYHLSNDFNGGNNEAVGISRPYLSEFYAVAGKGKLCKSAGLSGAEKRACKKNIKATCGRKPMFGRAKKEKWSTCANSNVVTPEQSAQETADKLVPTREDSGLSTGAKVAIGIGVLGFLGLVGLAVANKRKAQPAMIQQPVMARR